jgi:hypothetical protein
MTPIRLTDSQLQEVLQAARMVPFDLRQAFLEQLAAELQGKDLGDGVVHGVAYSVGTGDHAGRRTNGGDRLG